jgi:hypothetical protein
MSIGTQRQRMRSHARQFNLQTGGGQPLIDRCFKLRPAQPAYLVTPAGKFLRNPKEAASEKEQKKKRNENFPMHIKVNDKEDSTRRAMKESCAVEPKLGLRPTQHHRTGVICKKNRFAVLPISSIVRTSN